MGLFISTFALADQHGQIINKGEKKKSPFIWNYLGAAKGQPGSPADIAGLPHIHRPHDVKGLSLVLKARL